MSQSANQSLPNDVAQLRDIAQAQQTRIDELERLVAIHEEMIRLMRIEKYGAKSEKLNDDQLSLLECVFRSKRSTRDGFTRST